MSVSDGRTGHQVVRVGRVHQDALVGLATIWQNRMRRMLEAVFLYRAASRPTQHLCMPAGTEPFSSWRVDGCSTGFQRPSMDSQRSWATLSS
jgi:hypothetical protein